LSLYRYIYTLCLYCLIPKPTVIFIYQISSHNS